MASWKKLITSGSIAELTAVSSSLGFYGTASWAVSSSHALTASYLLGSATSIFKVSGSTGSDDFNAGGDTLLLTGSNGVGVIVTGNGSNTTASFSLPQEIYPTSSPTFNNLTLDGDLHVKGSTTILETTNLLVEDKFILLASGSTTNVDGGLVVQNNTNGSGFALFLDSVATPRWGLSSSVAQTATSVTPDEYMVSAKQSAAPWTAASAAPTYGGTGEGFGNIVVDSGGEIWIYT